MCHFAPVPDETAPFPHFSSGAPRTDPHVKKPMKLMKMHDSPITVATTVEGYAKLQALMHGLT